MASIARHISIASQVRRIKKNLNSVVDKTKADVTSTMITQAALVASEIKSVAPVDPDSETPGALRDSVRVEEGRPTGKRALLIRILAGNSETLKQGKTGKPYNYPRAVEFGTQDAPARPFFFPIWRARRKAVRATVKKAIGKAVKGAFK